MGPNDRIAFQPDVCCTLNPCVEEKDIEHRTTTARKQENKNSKKRSKRMKRSKEHSPCSICLGWCHLHARRRQLQRKCQWWIDTVVFLSLSGFHVSPFSEHEGVPRKEKSQRNRTALSVAGQKNRPPTLATSLTLAVEFAVLVVAACLAT